MPRLKKNKYIWVYQKFGDLWRYEKVKEYDYKDFLKQERELGEKNSFLTMLPAPKHVVAYKSFLEFLQNKYVDKIIFIIIGYFLKILLDKFVINK